MAAYINCTQVSPECPVSATVYGYTPSLAANAVFLALFGVVAVIQTVQGIAWKTWAFTLAFILGTTCEIIGLMSLRCHKHGGKADCLHSKEEIDQDQQ